ncbi:PAAR domain-containing protein [Pseudochrobactrum sp. HB0163]|uniref:PAAR domain-containing protein n=1 Tax=Pseudochrobactrum sp. HB0163 TaxID=3450708 RepID=UPI003F6E33D0
MFARPVALLGHNHICPQTEIVAGVPVPHTGGPIITAQQCFVTVCGVPVATIADKAICAGVGQMDEIQEGSSIASIQGRKISRAGDCCQHGGVIVQGIPWITLI